MTHIAEINLFLKSGNLLDLLLFGTTRSYDRKITSVLGGSWNYKSLHICNIGDMHIINENDVKYPVKRLSFRWCNDNPGATKWALFDIEVLNESEKIILEEANIIESNYFTIFPEEYGLNWRLISPNSAHFNDLTIPLGRGQEIHPDYYSDLDREDILKLLKVRPLLLRR